MGILAEHDGRGFVVMEYVDGHPLLAHMRAAGRIGVATGLRYIKEICRALALVHAQGAVHRDLKPDNILIDRRGVVRVVDFGLATYASPRLGFAPGSLGTFTYMAPETLLGRSTPASDIYGLGLMMYELFAGGGPHLTAPWSTDEGKDHRDEHYQLKQSLLFPAPSEKHNEIRNDVRWLDGLILRCLRTDEQQRFADASRLLAAIQACETGEELPAEEAVIGSAGPVAQPTSTGRAEAEQHDDLFREIRRLLANRAYDEAIDRLDVYRPPEWAVVDGLAARTLRLLGQAYLGRGDLAAARDCLEQLRTAQKEQALLPRTEYSATLSDLVRCYRGLGRMDLADECQEEARRQLQA
jgi:hypothetical protein